MRARWLVDAMNVIGSRPDGWWKDRKAAMRALAEAVDRHARATGRDVTVVFDQDPGPLPELPNIKVVIAGRRGPNAADDEIHRLVDSDGDPSSLHVVTSDRHLIEKVKGAGAQVISSSRFRAELDY